MKSQAVTDSGSRLLGVAAALGLEPWSLSRTGAGRWPRRAVLPAGAADAGSGLAGASPAHAAPVRVW